MLTDSSINIDCVDPLGRTALLMAIDNENLEMIELLLEHKVDCSNFFFCSAPRHPISFSKILFLPRNDFVTIIVDQLVPWGKNPRFPGELAPLAHIIQLLNNLLGPEACPLKVFVIMNSSKKRWGELSVENKT